MSTTEVIYLVFGIVLVLALFIDLGLLSKKNAVITTRVALIQTGFWISLSLVFGMFIWYEDAGGQGKQDAIRYLSAYLLEWSLSIDNIFVFIIIFSFFKVRPLNYSR